MTTEAVADFYAEVARLGLLATGPWTFRVPTVLDLNSRARFEEVTVDKTGTAVVSVEGNHRPLEIFRHGPFLVHLNERPAQRDFVRRPFTETLGLVIARDEFDISE